MEDIKTILMAMFKEAVHVCSPAICLAPHIENLNVTNGLCVIGAGKAAVDMASAVYQKYPNESFGTVVTRHGYNTDVPTGNIDILFASHPLPDKGSMIAAQTLRERVANNPKNIPILFLISGGGSALISLPAEGVTFDQKLAIHRFLLRSGASIDEMNVVRKQLSAIKGGKLAQLANSPYSTLVISDVVGDDPSLIASGPTVYDASTKQHARDILAKYHWKSEPSIEALLQQPEPKKVPSVHDLGYTVVANANRAIDAAAKLAQNHGWETQVIDYAQQGEASDVAKAHAKIALSMQQQKRRMILLSGGELTVTLKDANGQGGPNQEYMLALAIALDGAKGIYALSCDTDGVDGNRDIAGAYIDDKTLIKACDAKLDPEYYLDTHNSGSFFAAIDGLIVTGPTQTNVNDFRAIVIC